MFLPRSFTVRNICKEMNENLSHLNTQRSMMNRIFFFALEYMFVNGIIMLTHLRP